MKPPDFDRVARLYRWAEYAALGPLLQRTRTHFLPELGQRRHALVLGDGDGRFLAALLRRHTHLRAHAVDGSAQMLALLGQRCSFAAARLTTQQTNLLALHTATPADLIVSHFVFDCFPQTELDKLIARTSTFAASGALWLVSDFGLPRSPVLRPFAHLYVRALYLAFRLLTRLPAHKLPAHEAPFARAGWSRVRRHTWLGGFVYSELWQRGYNQPTGDATPHNPQPSTLL